MRTKHFRVLCYFAIACTLFWISCKKEQIKNEAVHLTEIRTAIQSAQITNNNFVSALLEVVEGTENSLAAKDYGAASKKLNALASIVFASKLSSISIHSGVGILDAVYNSFKLHNLDGLAFAKVNDMDCGGDRACSVPRPGWKCFSDANGCIAGGP